MALLLSVTAFAAQTQDSTEFSKFKTRPKIGLVLSGGGAKGIAHIGVLKMLEELNIPVDYVTGTSIGSIIGGLYSLGYTPDEMETLIINTDWNEMMKDALSRHERTYEFNARDDRLLIDIPVVNSKHAVQQVSAGSVDSDQKTTLLSNVPMALVEGQNLNSLFTQLSVGYQDNIDFDDLPIPFACVAVDLVSRKPVVIRKGNIVDAMRSSMSIPGYFAPVQKEGKMLVDGGMLNNLPVDVVRKMGADIVIAVDLHKFDKSNYKTPDNLGDMVSSILKILNGEKYKNSVADADICITPNTEAFGILDFTPEALKALSDSGYFAALEKINILEDLSRAEKNYWQEKRPVKKHAINIQNDSIHICQVQISGIDGKEEEYIRKHTVELVGEYVNGRELDSLVRALYSTRAFSKVTYSVCNLPQDSSYLLKLQFIPEKKHSLGLGMRFDTETIAAVLLNISLNRYKLFGWRAELDANLSYNPIISVSASYAINNKWQLNAGYRFRRSEVAPYESGRKLYSYSFYYHGISTDIEYKGKFSNLRLYHMYFPYRIPTTEALNLLDNLALGVKYGYDNYDNCYFPTRGLKMKGDAYYAYLSKPGNEANSPYFALNFDISGVIPVVSGLEIIPSFMTRLMFCENSIDYRRNLVGGYEAGRYLDGQMPFVGANYSYFAKDLASIGRVDLQWNFVGKHYLTAIGNVLVQSDSLKSLETTSFNWGVGGGYTYKSFLGPVGIRVHYSDLANKVGVYLYAGYSF